MKKNRKFSFEEKVNCVKDYLENGLSGKEVAIKYALPKENPSYIYAWAKIVCDNNRDYNALKVKITIPKCRQLYELLQDIEKKALTTKDKKGYKKIHKQVEF